MEVSEVDPFGGNFEVKLLLKHLKSCQVDGKGPILLDEYIEVFKQLYK